LFGRTAEGRISHDSPPITYLGSKFGDILDNQWCCLCARSAEEASTTTTPESKLPFATCPSPRATSPTAPSPGSNGAATGYAKPPAFTATDSVSEPNTTASSPTSPSSSRLPASTSPHRPGRRPEAPHGAAAPRHARWTGSQTSGSALRSSRRYKGWKRASTCQNNAAPPASRSPHYTADAPGEGSTSRWSIKGFSPDVLR